MIHKVLIPRVEPESATVIYELFEILFHRSCFYLTCKNGSRNKRHIVQKCVSRNSYRSIETMDGKHHSFCLHESLITFINSVKTVLDLAIIQVKERAIRDDHTTIFPTNNCSRISLILIGSISGLFFTQKLMHIWHKHHPHFESAIFELAAEDVDHTA